MCLSGLDGRWKVLREVMNFSELWHKLEQKKLTLVGPRFSNCTMSWISDALSPSLQPRTSHNMHSLSHPEEPMEATGWAQPATVSHFMIS